MVTPKGGCFSQCLLMCVAAAEYSFSAAEQLCDEAGGDNGHSIGMSLLH